MAVDATRHSNPTLNPQALSIADAAILLSRVGGTPISVEMITLDRAAGAPANPDGTLHLVHYAAWLIAREGAADAD
jgi:hypothetical protein